MLVVRVVVTSGHVSVCAGCQLLLNEVVCIQVLHVGQLRFRRSLLIIICSRPLELAASHGLVLHPTAPSILLLDTTSCKLTQVICWGEDRIGAVEIDVDLAVDQSSSSLFCIFVTFLLLILFQ